MIADLLFGNKNKAASQTQLNDNNHFINFFSNSKRTSSGVTVNSTNAMQLASVYSCVTFLSKIMASLPIDISERTDEGTRIITEDPVAKLLTYNPNPEMTIYDFVSVGMGHLTLRGNFYAELVYDGEGKVSEIWPINPDLMQLRHYEGELIYLVQTANGQIPLRQDEVIHVKWFTNDGISGISPIQHAAQVVGHAQALDEFSQTLLANDATPPLMIEVPVGLDASGMEDQMEWIKSFKDRGTGTNRHRVGMLNPGMKLHQLSVSNDDMQFLESRQYTDRLICALFGVPSVYLNDAEKDTFASGNQKEQDLRKYTLGPLARNWELELTTKLFRKTNYSARFNFTSLLRADPETRSKIRASDISVGVISPNEGRQEEGLNKVDGLDYYNNTKQAETIIPGEAPQESAVEAEVPQTGTLEPAPAPQFDVHASYQPLLRDAVGRILTKEIRQIRASMKRNSGDSEGFKAWVADHYENDKKTLNDATQALSAISKSASELGIDLKPEDFASKHCKSSKAQLLAVMKKHPSEQFDALNDCLVDWEENRSESAVAEMLEFFAKTEKTTEETDRNTINLTVNMPEQTINVEAGKAPEVTVENKESEVTVNIPEQPAPNINVLPADAKIDNQVNIQPVIRVEDAEVDD